MFAFLTAIEDIQTKNKLEAIYLEYYRDMYVTAYSILKDHQIAEDIIQDAIIRLSNNLSRVSDIKCKKTRSYLVIIVRNLAYNFYNKRKKIVLLEDDQLKNIVDNEILIEEHLLKDEQNSEIVKCLKKLTPSYADILTLRFYYDLSIVEISETLDITTNNVSVKINRAIKTLKNILIEEGVVNE